MRDQAQIICAAVPGLECGQVFAGSGAVRAMSQPEEFDGGTAVRVAPPPPRGWHRPVSRLQLVLVAVLGPQVKSEYLSIQYKY